MYVWALGAVSVLMAIWFGTMAKEGVAGWGVHDDHQELNRILR